MSPPRKRYAAGSTLALVGKSADAFYVILDGHVRVDVPGRAVELGAGDFFGEIALIDGETRSASVVALSDLFVMSIPRSKFLKLLEAEPKIALAIMATPAVQPPDERQAPRGNVEQRARIRAPVRGPFVADDA